ncbi:MAG: cupredoxin domain-containing protein [Anaeromyxobacteraceae bacterium]|nr:cupredoxin domain-containing protein [Anaeromyxobacteraceae bacterium]
MTMKSLAAAASFAVLSALPSAALAQHDHAGMGHQMSGDHAAPATAKAGQAIDIAVTSDGFAPASIKVKQGQPVKLVVTRKTDRTCATEIVIKDAGISQKLPLNQPVTVEFTPKKSGQLRYACGMDMISGVIVVE